MNDFHMNLPRGRREFACFMLMISVISVNIIAPLITCFEAGFTLASWGAALRSIPFVWLAVVALVLLTYRPAEWLTHKVCRHGDSFRAVVTINILCTVLMLSIVLTVVATWIATRHIGMEPIAGFFYKWPRNFSVSLGVELLVAQPIARLAMQRYHRYADARTA